jgi:hypothetical protein
MASTDPTPSTATPTPAMLYKKLRLALRADDTTAVQELMQDGVTNTNALKIAVENNSAKMVDVVLSNFDAPSGAILSHAVKHAGEEVMEVLLETLSVGVVSEEDLTRALSVGVVSEEHLTRALGIAVRDGKFEIARLLLEAGATHTYAMRIAVKNDDIPMVCVLSEYPSSTRITHTMLDTAAEYAGGYVMETLCGTLVEITGEHRKSDYLWRFTHPLYIAVRDQKTDVVEVLLSYGAKNRYAIGLAIKNHDMEMVEMLVENGVHVTKNVLLTAASANVGSKMMEYLIEQKYEFPAASAPTPSAPLYDDDDDSDYVE